MDIYKEEFLDIGIVFAKAGQKEKAETYIKDFKDFADQDRTIYKHAYLAMYYAYRNDVGMAIEHLTLFSKEDNYIYWILLIKDDPLVDNIKDLPQFKKVMRDIENKFWATHEKIKKKVEEEGLP